MPASATEQAATALARMSRKAKLRVSTDTSEPKRVVIVRGSYDAAQTTNENTRHWMNADMLSAAAAGAWDIRQTLRARARYEVANNSIARGIVLTLANDVIGTGPRLQLMTEDEELNQRVEGYFHDWARSINLAGKLRTMRTAKAQDGEAFGAFVSNRAHRSPVKLDLRLIEADRVTTPTVSLVDDETKAVDGIVFDEAGNPREYHVLRVHPGATGLGNWGLEQYDTVPARSMVHWFRADRPGQRRGLPDIMPALPLFALLRRFTLATITAAETAADWALIMKTIAPPGGEAAEVDPWVTMNLERNAAMFAPEGWEPSQLKGEHPNAQFREFRKAIIGEIARCLNMPLNVAACDSSDYNMASGKLDHATYYISIRVERSELEVIGLDRLFDAWLMEALRVGEYELAGELRRGSWPRTWYWPNRPETDPRWAKAQVALLQAGLLTENEYLGGQGIDWDPHQEQRKRERQGRIKRELPEPTEAVKARAAELIERVADEVAERTEDE